MGGAKPVALMRSRFRAECRGRGARDLPAPYSCVVVGASSDADRPVSQIHLVYHLADEAVDDPVRAAGTIVHPTWRKCARRSIYLSHVFIYLHMTASIAASTSSIVS